MKNFAFAIASGLMIAGCTLASAQGIHDEVAAATPVTYTFTEVNYPDDTFTQLLGINNSGVIAGYHGSGLDPANPNKGFTLTLPNNFTAQNFPNSTQTQVIGINDSGNTAGFYVDNNQKTFGFYQAGGQFRQVSFPGTTFNQLLSYNNNSQAAGYWQDSAGNFHPYIFNRSTPLISILIPGAVSAQATNTNNLGAVSGFYIDAQQVNHGYLYENGDLIRFTYPGSTFTQALGVNDLGVVVGTYTDASGNNHGFLWSPTTGYRSIDDPNGIGTTVVNGINNAGTLVGFWGNTAAGISHGFVATPE
jgi:probable HAF family extracellular repeat protein